MRPEAQSPDSAPSSGRVERRRWPRFIVNLDAFVQLGRTGGDVRSLVADASEGGLFIVFEPPVVGTRLIIEIPAAGGERSIVVAGRVVRRIVRWEGPRPRGAGIEITARTSEWTVFCAQFASTST